MSDGKNALTLPGNHIDFNLNLKIILPPLLDTQKTVPEIFDVLVSFAPSDISVRHEIQGDKRMQIMI